jgi:choice-of-anchor B domain-containing protein
MLNRGIEIICGLVLIVSSVMNAQTPCQNGMAGEYPCLNMDLLAHMTNADIGGCDNTNDIWGWVSPITGKEYALVGCSNGTAFVDISNPSQPIYLGLLPCHDTPSLWRDLETLGNFVFVVSESSNHGLQVMNLLQLDNVVNPPVNFAEDAHYSGFGHCHTLNIDPTSQLLCAMGTNTFNGGPHLLDVSNPLNPIFVGGYGESGYTHDGFITTYSGPDLNHQGEVIIALCNGYNGFFVVNATDPNDVIVLDNFIYPETGYTHQGWFTKDKRYFLINDELDEMNIGNNTRTHFFDLNDLDNMVYLGFHETNNTSIDHNLYADDQFIYESNYRSGVRVFDAVRSSDAVLNEVAFFDLVPANDNPQFSGTWSNYPYLPSGINLATSMYDGFFITRPTFLQWSNSNYSVCQGGGFSAYLEVNTNLLFPLALSWELPNGFAANGISQITQTGDYYFYFDTPSVVAPGEYELTLNMTTQNGQVYTKVLRVTVQSQSAPGEITLIAPELNANLDGNPIAFEWTPSTGANYYIWTMATDVNFLQNVQTQSTTNTILSLNAMESGQHFWKVEAMNDCGTSQIEVGQFDLLSTGVDVIFAESFQLYPNPAQSIIYFSEELNSFQILDLTGRVVSVHNGIAVQEINLHSLSDGMYWLRSNGIVKSFEVRH